jgi:hypothetical protein
MATRMGIRRADCATGGTCMFINVHDYISIDLLISNVRSIIIKLAHRMFIEICCIFNLKTKLFAN